MSVNTPDNENTYSDTGVGVLDKAMAILSQFDDGAHVLTPPEVSSRLGLTPSTSYRLMKAMAEHGLLRPAPSGYQLGITLLSLGDKVAQGLEIRDVVRPHLREVSKGTGENAELQVRVGDRRVPVEVVPSERNIRPIVEVGAQLPLHVGAGGHVLLAWASETDARSVYHAAVEMGDIEIDLSTYEDRLRRVRARGWAESVAERQPEVASVAAPIRDRTGEVVGALVLSGPAYRLPSKTRSGAADLVCREALLASAELGFPMKVDTARSRA